MALGGGSWTTQNKILPGAYINFVSAASATPALSDRGIVTMPLELDWGKEDEIFEVTNADFQKDCQKIFGYSFDNENMKGLRDLFKGAKKLYAYRLNGGGVKATNAFATALYGGTRGNALKTVISVNVDDNDKWDVETYLGTVKVDEQTVANAAGLVANDYVTFKADATLAATAGTPLAGGTNKTVTGAEHSAYISAVESYSFNTIGVVTTDDTIKALYAAFVKRMRDDQGIKFQCVLYNKAADYMGVINVKNTVSDQGASPASLVYWVTGAEGGCPVNKSCLNKKYDGEFNVVAEFTQSQLEAAIQAGEFAFHKVGGDIRVLDDINSMVTVTDEVGEVFKSNQTIRVIDQIGNDDAVLFNTKYLGVVPNNASGRTSLWSDLVKIRQQLQDIAAIQDFNDSDVTVQQGNSNRSVTVTSEITVVNAMAKLYMTVMVA